MIIQGSNEPIVLTFGFDPSTLKAIEVDLSKNDVMYKHWDKSELLFEDCDAICPLTQGDTMNFPKGILKLEIKWCDNDNYIYHAKVIDVVVVARSDKTIMNNDTAINYNLNTVKIVPEVARELDVVDTSTGTIIRKGYSPYVDEDTGTWWVYDDSEKKWVDTELSAGIMSVTTPTTSTGSHGKNTTRITLTDGSYQDIDIYNGTDGVSVVSITPVSVSTSDSGTSTYKITLSNDESFTFSVRNGSKGSTGVSVTGITPVSVSTSDNGNSIYRLTFSNGQTFDFNVKNGSKGSKGDNYIITQTDYSIIVAQTVSQIRPMLDAKVDKENGKSLVDETEIARLKTVKNYDDAQIRSKISEVEEIAKGRAKGFVFATKASMDEWLSYYNNLIKLKQGDNLYIIQKNVPDYWWDGKQAQELETQKVDLSEYFKMGSPVMRIGNTEITESQLQQLLLLLN